MRLNRALPSKTQSIFSFKRNSAMNAAMAMPKATQSSDSQTGLNIRSGPTCTSFTESKRLWRANQTAKFNTTPTTAAVIPDKAVVNALLFRQNSINGAPRKIHRKQCPHCQPNGTQCKENISFRWTPVLPVDRFTHKFFLEEILALLVKCIEAIEYRGWKGGREEKCLKGRQGG